MTTFEVNNSATFISALNYAFTKEKDEKVYINLINSISLYGVTWPFSSSEFHNVHIDGNGYYITNLNITGEYGSLFGKLNFCTIGNLRLKDFTINTTKQAGALALEAYESTIRNIEVTKSIITADIAGGVCSTSENTVFNVIYLADTTTVAGNYCAGGVVGIAFKNSKFRNIQTDVKLEAESKQTWLGGVLAVAVVSGGEVLVQTCVSNAQLPIGHDRADGILARKLP